MMLERQSVRESHKFQFPKMSGGYDEANIEQGIREVPAVPD